jgi:hypothetical protein
MTLARRAVMSSSLRLGILALVVPLACAPSPEPIRGSGPLRETPRVEKPSAEEDDVPAGDPPVDRTKPPPPVVCTVQATTQAQANAAKPGDVVCFQPGTQRFRLSITTSGTADKPIIFSGEGLDMNGVEAKADHIVIQKFKMKGPQAPGIRVSGQDIVVQDNVITSPVNGDGDGMRFFGKDIKILRNTVSGTSNRFGHADCMQTYSSDSPPSEKVLIEGNRCEKIDNMGLMAEGPNDGEGDGVGHTHHITLRNNFFETLKASQAIMLEDVQFATITNNEFAGAPEKAIGLDIGSTNATVSGNKLGSGIRFEVGMDDSSRTGYSGPEPGGGP